MHYLPTRSTPVPTKMPIIIGALLLKTSAMTPGQLCRKTEQTEHLVQYSWVKEVKQCSLQWWQDHCKRLHLLAPTYRHLDAFKKPIWFGAGRLNELYYGDASCSTAVKLQSRQMKEEVKGGKKQVLNTTLRSPVEKLNTLTASTGIEMDTADSDVFCVYQPYNSYA